MIKRPYLNLKIKIDLEKKFQKNATPLAKIFEKSMLTPRFIRMLNEIRLIARPIVDTVKVKMTSMDLLCLLSDMNKIFIPKR